MDDKGDKNDGNKVVPETEKLFSLGIDDIKDDVESQRPDEREFADIYPSEECEADFELVKECEKLPDGMSSDERSRVKDLSHATDLEMTFINALCLGDWFNESDFLEDEENPSPLNAVPTAKADDSFNHIDAVLAINNEITGHSFLPFAIDLTYNTNFSDMKKKFQWKHCYEKTDDAPKDVSEFGKIVSEIDDSGHEQLRYDSLDYRYRRGLKIPGFASAKYFEDKDNSWSPMHKKGRITVMPRLIVGYSTEIIETMANGAPTKHFREKNGEAIYQTRKKEYENAERRAKWCTLIECREQVKNIRFLLEENLYDNEKARMNPEELEEAKNQILMLNNYFTKAYESAVKKAEDDPDEKAAMEYAENRDSVCQSILEHSYNTYVYRK